MRALILGDTHTYFERVVPDLLKALELYNYDTIIQVGDMAYLPKMWTPKIEEEIKLLVDFVNNWNLKFYWIDGNHEDHSILQTVENFNDSTFNTYGKNFIYQPRGSYLELDKYVLFFIGGAETRDIENRVEGLDFFRNEIVTRDQEELIFNQMEIVKSLGKQIIVISHTCPAMVIDDSRNLLDLMGNSKDFRNVPSGIYQNKILDEILLQLNPRLWFHGHYHKDRVYTLPQVHNGQTTFFSLGAYVKLQWEKNDRKYQIVDL